MALAFRAASAPVFGGAVANPTAAPTLPTGTASGDRVYIVCASKPSATAITGTTGWTSLSASVLGGTIRVTVLARTYDGVWTMPTLAVVGTTTTGAIGAAAASYQPDAGFEVTGESVTTGSDTTSGTGFSATGAANLSLTTGDGLLALTGISATTANGVITATGGTLTATSATIGTVTEQADAGSANGADSAVKIHEALVTAGTSSAAPVHAETLSAASTGGTVFVRVRQSAAAIGQSARYDADEAHFSPTLGLGSQADFTFACFCKVTVDRNDFSTVMELRYTSTTGLYMATDADGVTIRPYDDGVSIFVVTGAALVVGEWYFMALATAGAVGRLYIRQLSTGTVVTDATYASGARTLDGLIVGSSHIGEFLNGNVCGIRMWTAGLTSTELASEATQYDAVRTANLVRAWRLNGTAAETNGLGDLTGGATATWEPGPPGIPLGSTATVTKEKAQIVNRARLIRANYW